MSPKNKKISLSNTQKWHLIAQNLKSWYTSWPSAKRSRNIFLSDPEVLLTPERATVSSPELEGSRIDQMLEYYRSQKLVKEVLIWYLHDSPPERLNAKFLARGVTIMGSPDRMWCELLSSGDESAATSCVVEGVEIEIEPVILSETSPVARYILTARMSGDDPLQTVGSVTLNLTPDSGEGDARIGGLFDMFVSSEFRNRGIGTMLAGAACDLARELGCQGLQLNSSKMGKRVYERVGFEMMGHGCIWRIDRRLCSGFYEEEAPREETVKFLEAICLGDVDVLEKMGGTIEMEEMQQPTRNGMTPFELAVSCSQTGSAEWLMRTGIEGDVLSLWDLGRKDKARELVDKRQEMIHVREGRSGRTFLDVAIQRDEQELAALLAGMPLPRVGENKKNDIDFGAMDWEGRFDGVET